MPPLIGSFPLATLSDSPRNIPGIAFWYRGDFVHLTGGAVDTATDMSGLGRNATQTTPSQRPVWGATSGPNSTPAWTFTSASHQQLVTAAFTLPNLQLDIFFVVKPNNADPGGCSVLGNGDGTAGERFNCACYGGDFYDAVMISHTTPGTDWESTIQPLNGALIVECRFDKTATAPNNSQTFINGVLSGGPFSSGADPATWTNETMFIGGQFPNVGQFSNFPGVIAEIIGYSAVLTAQQKKDLLRGYLGKRYAISVP